MGECSPNRGVAVQRGETGREMGKIGHAEGWDVPLLLRPYYLGITYEYHTTCAIGEQAMPYCEP